MLGLTKKGKLVKVFWAMLLVITLLMLTLSMPISGSSEASSDEEGETYLTVEDLLQEQSFINAEFEKLEQQYGKEFLAAHDKSIEIYSNMIDSFENRTRSGSEIIYPDYYGGSFIDENGLLNVYVKDFVEEAKNSDSVIFIRSLRDENVKIQSAKYSHNELIEIMDKLNTFKEKNFDTDVAKNFDLFWLSDKGNEIVVELNNYNDEQIKIFKDIVSDSSAIIFVVSSGSLLNNTSVLPGNQINIVVDGSTFSYSMGYRARRNNENGFVTSAHGGMNVNTTVRLGNSSNGTYLGRVRVSQQSDSVDAAFISTSSNVFPSNTIKDDSGTSQLSTTIPARTVVGAVVNKLSAATGHTVGTITSTYASSTFSGIPFTNLTAASYTSAGGDSGGIVYSRSGENTNNTLGIHKGNNPIISFYVKAELINIALGLDRY